MIRKEMTVFFFMVLITGCHISDGTSSVEFGSREKFVKELGLPYNAPQEKQALCSAFVDYLSSKETSFLADEVLNYIGEPDIVSFRFRDGEVVGLHLNYMLRMTEETYRMATYLSIQYDRKQGWGSAMYIDGGDVRHHMHITNALLTEKIYSVENKYQAEIEEVERRSTRTRW